MKRPLRRAARRGTPWPRTESRCRIRTAAHTLTGPPCVVRALHVRTRLHAGQELTNPLPAQRSTRDVRWWRKAERRKWAFEPSSDPALGVERFTGSATRKHALDESSEFGFKLSSGGALCNHGIAQVSLQDHILAAVPVMSLITWRPSRLVLSDDPDCDSSTMWVWKLTLDHSIEQRRSVMGPSDGADTLCFWCTTTLWFPAQSRRATRSGSPSCACDVTTPVCSVTLCGPEPHNFCQSGWPLDTLCLLAATVI